MNSEDESENIFGIPKKFYSFEANYSDDNLVSNNFDYAFNKKSDLSDRIPRSEKQSSAKEDSEQDLNKRLERTSISDTKDDLISYYAPATSHFEKPIGFSGKNSTSDNLSWTTEKTSAESTRVLPRLNPVTTTRPQSTPISSALGSPVDSIRTTGTTIDSIKHRKVMSSFKQSKFFRKNIIAHKFEEENDPLNTQIWPVQSKVTTKSAETVQHSLSSNGSNRSISVSNNGSISGRTSKKMSRFFKGASEELGTGAKQPAIKIHKETTGEKIEFKQFNFGGKATNNKPEELKKTEKPIDPADPADPVNPVNPINPKDAKNIKDLTVIKDRKATVPDLEHSKRKKSVSGLSTKKYSISGRKSSVGFSFEKSLTRSNTSAKIRNSSIISTTSTTLTRTVDGPKPMVKKVRSFFSMEK